MRHLLPPALALLTTACWTPGPGQLDPTLYPWDQPKPKGTYCMISLEQPSATGIKVGGQNVVDMACTVAPNR